MAEFEAILRRARVLTFDCYGTLIDWEAGLRRGFVEAFGSAVDGCLDAVFDAYLAAEMEHEHGAYRPYRQIVAESVRSAADRLGLTCTDAQAERMADGVGDWPPFSDSPAALALLKARYRLGILSNVDRDLLARSVQQLGTTFDTVITAEDVRSYKPAAAHFREFSRRWGRGGAHVHVAQSLYHDGEPCHRLNIPFVWINRRGDTSTTSASPIASFVDMATLGRAVSALSNEDDRG